MLSEGEKRVYVGSFLDAMKNISDEEDKLNEVGVYLSSLSEVQDILWENTKLLLGMPLEEKEGVFISDYWLELVSQFEYGELEKKETIDRLINWKIDFDSE